MSSWQQKSEVTERFQSVFASAQGGRHVVMHKWKDPLSDKCVLRGAWYKFQLINKYINKYIYKWINIDIRYKHKSK